MMKYGCDWCGAKPGEPCGKGENSRTPLEAEDRWEHGIHYGRDDGTSAKMVSDESMRRHKEPCVPLDGTEPGVEIAMKAMLQMAAQK